MKKTLATLLTAGAIAFSSPVYAARTCVDSDNGTDYGRAGEVEVSSNLMGTKTYEDKCEGKYLLEVNCNTNHPRVKYNLKDCGDEGCDNGACFPGKVEGIELINYNGDNATIEWNNAPSATGYKIIVFDKEGCVEIEGHNNFRESINTSTNQAELKKMNIEDSFYITAESDAGYGKSSDCNNLYDLPTAEDNETVTDNETIDDDNSTQID